MKAIKTKVRARKLSKSDVIREALERAYDIADLIGSVDDLPADLSTRKKHYLRRLLVTRLRDRRA